MAERLREILKRSINLVRRLTNRIPVPEQAPPATPRIGSGASIGSSEISKQASVGANCFLYQSVIGDFSYLSTNVSMMNTVVGKFCSIAQGTCVNIGDHPTRDFVSTHPAFFSPAEKCGVTFATESHFREIGRNIIGNDVWIGANAIIMSGLSVGDGAIIGAGSIVTKDVPPYAIVAGNPARILRYRFDDHEITFLLKFRWWDKEEAWIRANYLQFHQVKSFIKSFSSE